ncbi:MAG: TlpA family protein disulfide reductase [Deltaproteobacteria bacterium]|nr:TlpA family protein disulfide reductase [Deltaproteobacteria bacterium]
MFPRRALPFLLAVLLPGCGACDAYDPVEKPVRSVPIETLDGVPVDLAALKGRPLVVHFWLPSCHVCAREVPALMDARRSAADTDVQFLAVSIDPDVPSIRSRARALGLDLPLYVARGEVLGPMYVADAPSTVFIDRAGIIRAAVNGARDAAFLRRRIRDLLE